MRLNIIYDARRVEKYEPLIKELEGQGITDFEIFPCLMFPEVVHSINASHKMIVQDAKDKGLPEVFIAEDDLMFTAPGAWKYFLEKKPAPENYDLYLASTYIIEEPLKNICGFHLYSVSEKFYDPFLSVPDDQHIDTVFNDVKGDYHFCYPFPALQRPGFSANNMMVVNYNSMIDEKHLFK